MWETLKGKGKLLRGRDSCNFERGKKCESPSKLSWAWEMGSLLLYDLYEGRDKFCFFNLDSSIYILVAGVE